MDKKFMKPEKKRVFLACVVLAALLLVIGILRMNDGRRQAESAGERSVETLITAYGRKQKDLRLTTAVITGSQVEIRGYGAEGAQKLSVTEEISAGSVPEIPAGGGGELDAEYAGFFKAYELGSLSKTFVGALFGKYVSEGKLSLSDPVSRYIDFGGKYDPTLLELLTHTSAYEDYRTNGFIQMAKYRLGKNPYGGISSERVPVFMRRFSTGQKGPYSYSFSNFGYAVLGKVVEEVEGRPFSEVMMDFISEDLGLPDTGFSFDSPPDRGWSWQQDDAFLPAAGLSGDVTDLAAYVRLFFRDQLDEGRTLSITPQKKAEGSAQSGLGWGIRPDGIVGHGGETSRYSCQILFDSEKSQAVIVLSNHGEENGISVSEIAETLYGEAFE